MNENITPTPVKVGGRLDEIRAMIDDQPGIVPVNAQGVAQRTGSIDAKPFVQPFQDLIAGLEQKASSDYDKAQIEQLKGIVQEQFTGMPEFMTAAQVESKIQKFKELAEEYGKKYGNTGSAKSSSVAGISGRVADAFEGARRQMNDSIVQRLEAMNKGLADEYAQSRAAYGELKNFSDDQAKNFSDAKGVRNFLNKSMNDDIAANDLEKIQQITGVDLEDLAVKSQAIKTFSKPQTEIRSIGKSTTGRQLALGAATGAAGYYVGQQSGGDVSPFLTAIMAGALGSKAASPAALRKYMQMNAIMREAPTQIPGAAALPYTLMNANKNDQK